MIAMKLSESVMNLQFYQSELSSFFEKEVSLNDAVKGIISSIAEFISHKLKEHELKEIFDSLKKSKIFKVIKKIMEIEKND